MNSIVRISIILAVVVLLVPRQVMAGADLGLVLSNHFGRTVWNYTDPVDGDLFVHNYRPMVIGFVQNHGIGIHIGNSFARHEAFGYRLKALFLFSHSYTKPPITFFRYSVINAFDFKLMYRNRFKLWIGPLFYLGGLWGRDDRKQSRRIWTLGITGNTAGGAQVFERRLYRRFEYGIGGSLGFSYELSSRLFLTVELGVRAGLTNGRVVSGSFVEGFVDPGVIFRL